MNNIAIVLAMCLIGGCNTPPARIAPLPYNGSMATDCKKIERLIGSLELVVSTQRAQLQQDANIDTGIVAGALLFMPLALVALAATGNDELKNEYRINLGKLNAAKQVYSESCDGF